MEKTTRENFENAEKHGFKASAIVKRCYRAGYLYNGKFYYTVPCGSYYMITDIVVDSLIGERKPK